MVQELEAKCLKKKGKIAKLKGELDVIDKRYEKEIDELKTESSTKLEASQKSYVNLELTVEQLRKEVALAKQTVAQKNID